MSDDEQLVALAREQERQSRQLATLDRLLRDLAGAVQNLSARPDAAGAPLTSWLAPAGGTDLGDVVQWVGEVYLHYPRTVLPSCWLWHPSVLEELAWLRHAHKAAYDPQKGSWAAVGDWHDRFRPGVTKRIREAISDCELSRHTGDEPIRTHDNTAPLAATLHRIHSTWSDHRTTPEPTTDELTEATEIDHQSHRHH